MPFTRAQKREWSKRPDVRQRQKEHRDAYYAILGFAHGLSPRIVARFGVRQDTVNCLDKIREHELRALNRTLDAKRRGRTLYERPLSHPRRRFRCRSCNITWVREGRCRPCRRIAEGSIYQKPLKHPLRKYRCEACESTWVREGKCSACLRRLRRLEQLYCLPLKKPRRMFRCQGCNETWVYKGSCNECHRKMRVPLTLYRGPLKHPIHMVKCKCYRRWHKPSRRSCNLCNNK